MPMTMMTTTTMLFLWWLIKQFARFPSCFHRTKCKRVSCVCIIICYLNPVKTLMITHNGGGCMLYVVNIYILRCVKFDICLFITSAPKSIDTDIRYIQQFRRVNYHEQHAKTANKFNHFVAPST